MKKQAWKRASWTVTTQHEETSRGERVGGEVTLKLNNEHEREGNEVKLQNNKHENTSINKKSNNEQENGQGQGNSIQKSSNGNL